MPQENLRGDISRLNLERHDIYYHDGTGIDLPLPHHINAVREGLLTMEDIVPGSWKWQLYEERIRYNEANMGSTWAQSPPESAFVQEERHHLDRKKPSAKWELADMSLVGCHEIATMARSHLKDSEAEWNSFWRKHIFRLFSDEASKHPRFE